MKRFMVLALGLLALSLLVPLVLLAQTAAGTAQTPDVTTILTVLTPVVVYLVTKLVGIITAKYGSQIPSVVITAVVVPFLSLAAMFISQWLGGTNPWYIQLILGFSGTFVHELINNFQKPTSP